MRTHLRHARGSAAAVVLGALLAGLLGGCTGEDSAPTSRTTPGPSASPPRSPAGPLPSASAGAASPTPSAPATPPPAAAGGEAAPDAPGPATGDDAPAAPAPAAPPAAPPGAPPAAPPGAATAVHRVTVVITFGAWTGSAVEVGGYVDGHVEAGGTCSLTLTRDGGSVTGTAPGLPDAATTQCGVSVGGDRLSPGTWRATLSYTSPNASGSAADVTIEVP